MTKLTKRQQEILQLIESHIAATGSPPTRAEIAKTMGFRSPNAAEDHLRALARKQVIELIPGTSRGIRLPQGTGAIPVIKSNDLSVGQPLFPPSVIKGTCKLERSFFKPSIDYLVQLTNKGFPDLHLLEGDHLAIHQTHMISSGQMVLLRMNQELFVKRYTPDLHYSNLILEGLVIGVIRSLTPNSLES